MANGVSREDMLLQQVFKAAFKASGPVPEEIQGLERKALMEKRFLTAVDVLQSEAVRDLFERIPINVLMIKWRKAVLDRKKEGDRERKRDWEGTVRERRVYKVVPDELLREVEDEGY